jgi:hypothetical protein
MATIKVATLIETAGIILQDASQVRFPQAELMTFLNDAQREIVLHRPDSKTVNASVTCVAGSKQSLPSTGLRLVDVVRNDGGRAITQIARKILDETLPDWHNKTADSVKKIEHFVYDSADPKSFYLYPNATTSMDIEIIYSIAPSDITYSSSVTISLDDIYANAILDYMLYRAYQKDSEYAGNADRSMMHYSSFANALGMKSRADSAIDPQPTGPDRNAQRM